VWYFWYRYQRCHICCIGHGDSWIVKWIAFKYWICMNKVGFGWWTDTRGSLSIVKPPRSQISPIELHRITNLTCISSNLVSTAINFKDLATVYYEVKQIVNGKTKKYWTIHIVMYIVDVGRQINGTFLIIQWVIQRVNVV
jgi:hypothetical protein